MDKAHLEELRSAAEAACAELFKQVQTLQAELERTRGDFRTYDKLLNEWTDDIPEEDKQLSKLPVKAGKEK